MSGSSWGGLENNNNSTFIDGSVNSDNWWYSLGSISAFSGGVPGGGIVEDRVQLYIR